MHTLKQTRTVSTAEGFGWNGQVLSPAGFCIRIVTDLQLPIGEARTFQGVVDVVNKEKLLWNSNSGDGKDFERKPLLETSDPELLKETIEARNSLIEQVNTLF